MARLAASALPARRLPFASGVGASLLPERLVVLLRESRWLLQCCIAIFFALILLSYNNSDPGWSHAVSARDVRNHGGRLRAYLSDRSL